MKKIWLFVLFGVFVEAFLHGYIPKEFFIKYMGNSSIFAVPMAIIVGIPLYADATTIIPIAEVLIQKGGSYWHGFSIYDGRCLPFFARDDYFIKSNEKRINYKICDFYVYNLYFSWVFL